MDRERFKIIKANLNEKETDGLLAIYTQHDTDEWGEEAFVAIKEILLERDIDIENKTFEPTNETVSIHLKNSAAGGFKECGVILDGEIIGQTGPEGGEFDLPNFPAGTHTLTLSLDHADTIRKDSHLPSNAALFETNGDFHFVKVEFEYGECERNLDTGFDKISSEDKKSDSISGSIPLWHFVVPRKHSFQLWLKYLGRSHREK